MRYEEIRELLRRYFADALASYKQRVLDAGRDSSFVVSMFEADVARIDVLRQTRREPGDEYLALDELVLSGILECTLILMSDVPTVLPRYLK